MRARAVVVAVGLAVAATGAWALGPRPSPPAAGRGAPADDALAQGPPTAPIERQRGVALGMFAEDVSYSYGPLLAEIVALGATHVALVVPLYQTDGASDDLHLHTRLSPTLGSLAEASRAARRDGLEVMLFPIVRLSAPRGGEWRGTLAPRDPDAWFRRYSDLLGDLAAVAAATSAPRLLVGSELSSLDGDVARWRPLLELIRAVYKGKLVYSANWDHYREAKLLDLVDEAGVTGYFNLRESLMASGEATLEEGWRRVRRELEAWRSDRPTQPFFFSELGYRSRAGSTAAPWDESPGGTPDLDEQRRAFAAFRRVWIGSPLLQGVYIWNWYGYGGPTSIGYTPRGKPAELEVRQLLKDL